MNRSETAGEENEMCIFSQVKEYMRFPFICLSIYHIGILVPPEIKMKLLSLEKEIYFQPHRKNYLRKM